jgi:hypothetical protein
MNNITSFSPGDASGLLFADSKNLPGFMLLIFNEQSCLESGTVQSYF